MSKGSGSYVTEWVCISCGVTAQRPRSRGQIPKWCEMCRALKRLKRCPVCRQIKITNTATRYCSDECLAEIRLTRRKHYPLLLPLEYDMRSPIRRSLEDQDYSMLAAIIKARSLVDEGGCWIWQGKFNKDGYAVVRIGKPYRLVHRLSLQAKHQAPLGSQSAHHKCANTRCVNPAHLQPVTNRENVAEMLARQSYLSRIRELEKALQDVSPDHPLLGHIAVS